jgi:hypothetical protein
MKRTVGRTHGRTVVWGVLGLSLLCACATVRLSAQTIDTIPKRTSFAIRYGKWAGLAASIGLGLKARDRNLLAESAYDQLNDRCFDVPESCIVGQNGHYLDHTSEVLYGRTPAYDKQAGQFLIAAEVTFAVSVALFVYDLTDRQDRPPNIPFAPSVEYTPRGTNVGMSFKF